MLPQRNTISSVLQKHRKKAGIADIETYSRTHNGDEFLRYQDENMMIFAAEEDLIFLASCKDLFGDGTFKVAPPEYVQQYTIHGYFDGLTYPCVYVLLKGKTQVIYEKMLDEVLNLFPIGVTPVVETIMTDFEKAAINAFEKKFSDAQVAGCYFHLGQCAWRRIQREEANYKRYKEDPAFAIRVRRFLALAFVPPNEVHRYMNLLMADEVARNEGLLEFATYFQKMAMK